MAELIIFGILSIVLLVYDLKYYYEDSQLVSLDILMIIFIVIAIVGYFLFIREG